MFKQILKQLWFYRRGNAWLFVEMTLIAAASWFLVNAVWPGIYRTSLPDGYGTDGVYAVSLNRLSDGQNGYRPEMDTPEQRSVDFHRIGNALREMPEVQDAAPVGATLPGLNYSNYNRAIFIDTVNRWGYSYAYHIREAGASDLDLLGYRQVWPQGAPIEDLPNTVIITEDLAQALFPGENPVGRRLSQFSTYEEYGWRISGVIAPVKVEKDKEYRSFVMYAGSDIVALDEGMSVVWIFRVAPGVDEDAFIQQAKKTWREDLAFGNWRVASVMHVAGPLHLPFGVHPHRSGLLRMAAYPRETRGDRCAPGHGRTCWQHHADAARGGVDSLCSLAHSGTADSAECADLR